MNEQYSILAANSKTAIRHYAKEKDDGIRNIFARDRDRILYSKEFRRLEGKTQVFVSGFDDHIRNRLTHTLEVSQISRTIAEILGLNTTLCESIALAHDVGHTPFGHVGERTLNHLTNNCNPFRDFTIEEITERGFKHNWQGVKVVSTLENINVKYKGLNLTDLTIWGILNHSSLKYKNCKLESDGICNSLHLGKKCHLEHQSFSLSHYDRYKRFFSSTSWSLEALIVNIADEIAQRHHDIEDGIIAGIIKKEELIELIYSTYNEILGKNEKATLSRMKRADDINILLHDLSGFIIRLYILDIALNSQIEIDKYIEKFQLKNETDFYNIKEATLLEFNYKNLVSFSSDFQNRDEVIQDFLYSRILNSHLAQTMDGKANYILRNLIQAYLTNPNQLPDSTIISLLNNYLGEFEFNKRFRTKTSKNIAGKVRDEVKRLHHINDNSKYKTALLRTITDFIAGMTDKYALSQYKMLYGSDNYWLK